MNLIGSDISAYTIYTIRKRVYDYVMVVLNGATSWSNIYGDLTSATKLKVDTHAQPVERSVFNAVESVMAETHRMFPGNAVTFAAGWNPGMMFTTVAAPTTLTAPMIITAPHQIGGQP